MNTRNTRQFLCAPKIFAVFVYLATCALVPMTVSVNASAAPGTKAEVTVQEKVNLNQASAKQLSETLVGVGMTKAEAIVKFRETHGGFKHIDEIVEVKGIGKATFEKNKDRMAL